MRQSYWNIITYETAPLSRPPCINTECTYASKHITGAVHICAYIQPREQADLAFPILLALSSRRSDSKPRRTRCRVRSRFAESALSCTWKIVGLSSRYARADFYKFTCHFGERVTWGFPILLHTFTSAEYKIHHWYFWFSLYRFIYSTNIILILFYF